MSRLVSIGLLFAAPGMVIAEFSAQSVAINCQICHVQAESAIPSLSELTAQLIKDRLLDFKYQRSPATIMPRIAKGYTDVELAKVADYLGKR